MESILQADRESCFLCGMNASFEPLDAHHVFGGANRKLSEKYGLKVYLHHRRCHIFGSESVHQNAETSGMLKAHAQMIAMNLYGWSIEEWLKMFGKNYL